MSSKTNNKQLSRRKFLAQAAVAASAGGLGLSQLKASPFEDGRERGTDQPTYNDENWVSTGCQGCTSWCSVQVQVQDGRAIRVRGNPHSKVNQGSCCVRSPFALQQVYDPDRLKVPMKRTNPDKGRGIDPKFVPISWDEAMEMMADRIIDLRKRNETHKYVLIRGRYSGLHTILYDRMTKIIGSPNNISHSTICAEGEKFAAYYTEGLWDYRQYDVENARYVLIWGADPISTTRQVSYYAKVWGDVMDRAGIAVVDPRLSSTAAKADEWLPVTPGEDGAVALAMAHVILTEGLWNREFVGDFRREGLRFEVGVDIAPDSFGEIHTNGLIEWWNLELKNRTPEWAAERSGLPAEQIRRVAIDFGRAAPHSISWLGGGPVMQTRGAYAAMACHALNGLVGSCDNVGGTLAYNRTFNTSTPSADDFFDEIAQTNMKKPKIDQRGTLELPALTRGRSGGGVVSNRPADAILDEDPYDVQMIVAYHSNFTFSTPEVQRWERAMAKVPFSVHITTHASEFSYFSDLVLPAAHQMMEKWGVIVSAGGGGYAHQSLLQPCIKPLFEVKQDETEIPFMLAEKLAEKGFDNLLNYYKTFKDPESGAEPSTPDEFALHAIKHVTQKYWMSEKYEGGDRFESWEEFCKVGVWNSDHYAFRKRWEDGFATKTKRFEFLSETLRDALAGHAEKHSTSIDEVLDVCKYQARGELAFMPHYEEPYMLGDEKEFPLIFVDHKSRLNREGRSANCSWFHELRDVDPGEIPHQDTAKVNPIDGKRFGLRTGDRVRIVSPFGENLCTVHLFEGVRPGTLVKAYGMGHWAYGKLAAAEMGKRQRGGNNNELLPAEYDRLSGSSAFYAITRVRIEKA